MRSDVASKPHGRRAGVMLVLAVVACLIPLVGVAMLLGGGDRDESAHVVAPAARARALSRSAARHVHVDVRATFGVLRRSLNVADAIDSALARSLRQRGVDPARARMVIPSAIAGNRYYVVPMADQTICLLDGTGSGSCDRAVAASRTGMFGINECPVGVSAEKMALYGLVPDGVKTVVLLAADGDRRSVSTSDNGWYATVDRSPAAARPTSVSWKTKAGARHSQAMQYSSDVAMPCRR